MFILPVVASWHDDTFPELRSEPPWVMEDMIEVELALPSALASASGAAEELAAAVGAARDGGDPIVVTGCGTSEHAAQAIAALLDDALEPGSTEARPALSAAAAPRSGGLCIGVSHEGGTTATVAALAAARMGGAVTALVTAVPESPATERADLVLATPALDGSWCHTVGYVSPMLAGGLVAAALSGRPIDAGAFERFLRAVRSSEVDPTPLRKANRVIAAGAEADAVTARELALKVAEGARLPTAAYDLENILHGHLVAHDERSAIVVVATGAPDSLATRRARQVLAAAGRIGLAKAAIAPSRALPALRPDVAVPVDVAPGLPPLLGRLLGGAIALQLLTLALAEDRGVNPDLLRREEAPYRAAAAAADDDVAAVYADPA